MANPNADWSVKHRQALPNDSLCVSVDYLSFGFFRQLLVIDNGLTLPGKLILIIPAYRPSAGRPIPPRLNHMKAPPRSMAQGIIPVPGKECPQGLSFQFLLSSMRTVSSNAVH